MLVGYTSKHIGLGIFFKYQYFLFFQKLILKKTYKLWWPGSHPGLVLHLLYIMNPTQNYFALNLAIKAERVTIIILIVTCSLTCSPKFCVTFSQMVCGRI